MLAVAVEALDRAGDVALGWTGLSWFVPETALVPICSYRRVGTGLF